MPANKSAKAKSEAQQQAAGIARAAKKGTIPMSRLRGASKQMAEGMSVEQLGEFAKTKHKGLPQKKEKATMKKNALISKLAELLKLAKGDHKGDYKGDYKGDWKGGHGRFAALIAKAKKPGSKDTTVPPAVSKKAEALTGAYAEGVFAKCAELNLEFEQALEVWNQLAALAPQEAPAG